MNDTLSEALKKMEEFQIPEDICLPSDGLSKAAWTGAERNRVSAAGLDRLRGKDRRSHGSRRDVKAMGGRLSR